MNSSRSAKTPRSRLPGAVFWLLAGLVLVLVRALLWAGYARTPIPYGPVSDSWLYLTLARGWIAGGAWPVEAAFHSPLYPVLLGLSLKVSYGSAVLLLLLQNLAGVASGLLVLVWVRRFVPSPSAPWIVLGLLAAAGPMISYEWRLFPITWCLLGQLLVLEGAYHLNRYRGVSPLPVRAYGIALYLGLTLGILVALRPNFALLVPLFLGYDLWQRFRNRTHVGPTAVWVLAVMLVLAPFLIRNHELGAGYSLAANSGITFYHGNNPRATGGYARVEGVSMDVTRQNVDALATAGEGAPSSIPAANRYWWRQGLTHLASRPREAAGLLARKLLLLVSPVETGGDIPFSFERTRVPALYALSLTNFTLLLVLGLLALGRLPPSPFPRFGLVALLLVPAVTSLVFYATTRYRLSAWPLLILLAGLVWPELARSVSSGKGGGERRNRWVYRGGLVLGLVGVGVGVAAPVSLSAWVAGWHNWGVAAEHAGDPDAAVTAYREVLAIYPGHRGTLENLSRVAMKRRDFDAAQRVLTDLLEHHPDSYIGLTNQAMVHLQNGKWREARDAVHRAIAIRPGTETSYLILAEATLRLGLHDEACDALSRVAHVPERYQHLRRAKEGCRKRGRVPG